MGHDLGHTPFGHNGEMILDSIHPGGFRHNEQSLRVVEVLESTPNRRGMNLTFEVRDGILNHTGDLPAATLEGQIVKISDRIAYINHDIDDAIRGGILEEEDIPRKYREVLGFNTKERLNTMVHDIIAHSLGEPDIRMSEEVERAMQELRSFMFDSVYTNPKAKGEEKKAQNMLEGLFAHYMDHPEDMSEEYRDMLENKTDPKEIVVCDYISGMTDQYAIYKFEEYFVPKAWNA